MKLPSLSLHENSPIKDEVTVAIKIVLLTRRSGAVLLGVSKLDFVLA